MNHSPQRDQTVDLARGQAGLEHEFAKRRVGDAYARFYPALALAAVVLPVVPLFGPVERSDGSLLTYGSTLELAGQRNGGPAALGIVLAAVLVVLLAVASVRPSPGLAVAIAIGAVLVIVMVVTKPGFGDPVPPLSAAGDVAVIVGGLTAAIALAHAIHQGIRSR